MARGIQECNGFPFVFDLIGTNVLCDPAGLSGCNVGIADRVQQGCFPVVYVSQNGYDRRTTGQAARVFLVDDLPPERNLSIILFDFLLFKFFGNGFKTDFTGYDCRGIEIDRLVDVRHYAVHHEDLDNLNTCGTQQFCQVTHCYRNRNFYFLCSTHVVFSPFIIYLS